MEYNVYICYCNRGIVQYLVEGNGSDVGTGQGNTMSLSSLSSPKERRDWNSTAITPTTSPLRSWP